jgi:hypothetical protein
MLNFCFILVTGISIFNLFSLKGSVRWCKMINFYLNRNFGTLTLSPCFIMWIYTFFGIHVIKLD